MRAKKKSGILFRIARSNLSGNRLYSLVSFLTILLSMSFVSALILFLLNSQTASRRIVENMQHVMFMNASSEQLQELSDDPKAEMVLPYKESEEYKSGDTEYTFFYVPSQRDGIHTYVVDEGKVPEREDEIVVSSQFLTDLGKESKPGESVTLELGGRSREFTVSGLFLKDSYISANAIQVSRRFAENSDEMKDIPFTALVRIDQAPDMTSSEFEHAVYQMAADHHIPRTDININGFFQESLQDRNADLYACLLASLAIMAAGAVVIYSIFYLSVTSRVRQLGQLRTIGTTQSQIRKIIRTEGFLLGGTAIPCGIALGGVIAYVLEPDGFSLTNFAAAALFIALSGMAVVQLSIGKPASIAAAYSPIEAAKNAGGHTSVSGSTAHRRLTPFRLAWMQRGRDRKKWWLTTVSLAFGGIVLMTGATFIASWDEDSYSRQGKFSSAEFNISYLYSAHSNPQPYGITDLQLTGHLDDALREKLLDIPHVQSVEVKHCVFGNIEFQGAEFGQEFYSVSDDSDEYLRAFPGGAPSCSDLANRDAVLVTDSDLIEQVYGVSLKPGDEITLRWFDGEEHSAKLEIAAVTPELLITDMDSSFMMTEQTIRKLWGGMNTASAFRVKLEDERWAPQVESEITAILESYPDLSLSTLREQKEEDSVMVKQLNLKIYGLSTFIILFSVLNLVNTLISSIATRARELSMLESIGMEARQIRRMLFWESLFLALPNIVLTFTAGTAAGFAVVSGMKQVAEYLRYQFPFPVLLLYTAGMLLIPLAVSGLCLKSLSAVPLVERIKTGE